VDFVFAPNTLTELMSDLLEAINIKKNIITHRDIDADLANLSLEYPCFLCR
jgi:hypothetical protein